MSLDGFCKIVSWEWEPNFEIQILRPRSYTVFIRSLVSPSFLYFTRNFRSPFVLLKDPSSYRTPLCNTYHTHPLPFIWKYWDHLVTLYYSVWSPVHSCFTFSIWLRSPEPLTVRLTKKVTPPSRSLSHILNTQLQDLISSSSPNPFWYTWDLDEVTFLTI